MASQRTKFTVGLFVATGIGLALLFIIWLGMSRFLEKGQYYVTYFNESVQGLDRDSPVKYRGVSIGRIENIGVAPDSKLIQVVLKIESGQRLDHNIVAQLKSVGITGSMFIELDQKKKGEPDRSPPLGFPSEYPVVASKPSEISELLRGIADVLQQITALDLEGISGKVKLTVDELKQMIADVNLKGISQNIESSLERVGSILDNQRWDRIMASLEKAGQSLNTLMDTAGKSLSRLEKTFARVEGVVADNEKTIKRSLEDFRGTIEKASLFLEKGSSLVSGTDVSLSQLKRNLLVVTQNLERASENLNRLIGLLADQPSQLVFGQPPIARELESEVER